MSRAGHGRSSSCSVSTTGSCLFRSAPSSPVCSDGRLRDRVASQSRQPGHADVPVYDAHRLAGPDHELGAVRGVQPGAAALAGALALVSLSPTVEPFIVFGYVMFYFGPYFPAIWILRKLQAKQAREAFVSRHPLVSLGGACAGHRVRLGRVPRDHPGPDRHVHLLAGDSVGFGVRRKHLPVPADLGVVRGHVRDGSGGHPVLPR